MPTMRMIVNWVGDESNLQDRPSSLDVMILRNSSSYAVETITAQEGWQHDWFVQNQGYTDTFTARITTQTAKYNFSYEDTTSGDFWNRIHITTVTATYIPRPEPERINVSAEVVFYQDIEFRDWARPVYVDVTLNQDGVPYDTVRIGEGWKWNWTWSNLSVSHTWTITANEVENYTQEITHTDNDWRVAYQGNYIPPEPPDPSPGNHPTKEDLDLMYSVLYDDISAANALDIIHILDYGSHKENPYG